MTKQEAIEGRMITADTDMYGYPIDKSALYVVDHIASNGKPEYVTVEAWDNSHNVNATLDDAGDFAYLFA